MFPSSTQGQQSKDLDLVSVVYPNIPYSIGCASNAQAVPWRSGQRRQWKRQSICASAGGVGVVREPGGPLCSG
jgi:hypothetical protein